jgi:quercetin dioxygenase-like cupin family protein
MDTPHVQIGCVANLFSRQMHFKKAGDIEHGHTHPFDHLTLLAAGSLRVTVNGKATDFTAPHMIYIKAEFNHELVALEDNTVAFCIHALRKGNGVDDIIDPASIPAGVSPLAFADSVLCGNNEAQG